MKRSRPYPNSVVRWGQSEGQKWTLSRERHRQKRSASLNTSAEEIVARWLPEAPLCQGYINICLSNVILWKITGIQSIVFNPDNLQTIDLFKFWACFLSISFKLLKKPHYSSTSDFRQTSSSVLLLSKIPQHNYGQEWACALQCFPAQCNR